MLTIHTEKTVGRSEKQLANACKNANGVLITGALVKENNGRTREIDAVFITPQGVFTAEAKGTKLSGTVVPQANRDWMINGIKADFYGGANPLRQGRTAAQVLVNLLRENGVAVGYITAMVTIGGANVELAPTWVGDVLVTETSQIVEALEKIEKKNPIGLADAKKLCSLLGADISENSLLKQGFETDTEKISAADRTHAQIEAALSGYPGIYLKLENTNSSKSPETVGMLLAPQGVWLIHGHVSKQNGVVQTSMNEPWKIGEEKARYWAADNPFFRDIRLWKKEKRNFDGTSVPLKSLTLSIGPGIQHLPEKSSVPGVWSSDLTNIGGVFLREKPHQISFEKAEEILKIYSRTDLVDKLTEAEFEKANDMVTQSEGQKRRLEKRRERISALENQAEQMWKRSNERRLLSSILASCIALPCVFYFSFTAWLFGFILAGSVALLQLHRRAMLTGRREEGPFAMLMWGFTLVPLVGIGAGLAMIADSTSNGIEAGNLLQLLLSVIFVILFSICLLFGRSSYIHPPASVIEKVDPSGRAQGHYILVDVKLRKEEKGVLISSLTVENENS